MRTYTGGITPRFDRGPLAHWQDRQQPDTYDGLWVAACWEASAQERGDRAMLKFSLELYKRWLGGVA